MTPFDTKTPGLKLRLYAKDQPEYIPLPARADEDGRIITGWKLTWRDRLTLFVRGKLYLQVLTFNKPLQPVRLDVAAPRQ
jgi:hypothetical protein